ncbi:hypothetical protein SUGI_1104070 [Cryptomeria japonica]|nr:hypothetical protein SUGI_1104070 [Cryptomeria japonica]
MPCNFTVSLFFALPSKTLVSLPKFCKFPIGGLDLVYQHSCNQDLSFGCTMGNRLTKYMICFKSSEENTEVNSAAASSSTVSSSTKLPEELHECFAHFKQIEDRGNIDELIHMAQQILQRIKSKQQNNPESATTSSQLYQGTEQESGIWTSITNKGSQFLGFLNKFGSSEALHQSIKIAAEMLQQGGQISSIGAGLSTIAFVLSKYEKMRDNQPECLQALGDLINLAQHLRNLKKMIPEEEEKFRKAIQFIVEGSITCLRQSEDNKLFRFIKSSINNENLMSLRKRINELYPDLMLTTIIDMRKDIPNYLPVTNPVYPVRAVGIEMQVNEILDILRSTDQLSLAVVVYGFGGLGKTTLAEAVVSKMDLKNYNYSTIEIYQEQEKNDLTRSQQRILKDCFPNYNGGKPVVLTDYKDGRGHLMKAFKCEKEKPIFLFIDNALRLADLKNLLPEELEDLPRGSKILVTTRILQATDIFEGQPNLVRRPYHLQPLPDEEASKILFKNQDKAATIRKEDLNRILKICSGVPLALKIVGAQLHKQNYRVDRCSNILEILEKGDTIKEEKLSERLVDFVYGELEVYSREAWLDICCFFSKWSRQDVEYIVGAMAVTSLLETGLISSTLKRNHPAWEELIVHDIIKAKGQALAKGNRILDVQSLSEAVDEQRLHQIKGVWLSEDGIEEKHLKLMRKSLRVLAFGEGMEANRLSQMRFEELKFLQLSGNIAQLDKLDKLRVFHGPFFTEGGVTLCKLPRNLSSMKVIHQFHSSECTNSQMRGAPPCPSLEKLDFSELVEPLKLPEGFNQLVALNILILDDNEKMRELPEQICQLPALEVLSMRRCWHLKRLPESFGQLTTITLCLRALDNSEL